MINKKIRFVFLVFLVLLNTILLVACSNKVKENGFKVYINGVAYNSKSENPVINISYNEDWKNKILVKASYTDGTEKLLTTEYLLVGDLVDLENPSSGSYVVTVNYKKYKKVTIIINISLIKILKPTVNIDTILYTGEPVEFIPNNFDSSMMSITNNIKIEHGEYLATVSLKDKANYTWDDGTTNDLTFKWYISNKVYLDKPTEYNGIYTYNGVEQTYVPNGFNSKYLNITNNVQINAGTYSVMVGLIDKEHYYWKDGSQSELIYIFTINKLKLNKPTKSSFNYTYTSNLVTYYPDGFDESTMNITNNIKIFIGEYTCIISLRDKTNYIWNDGTNSDVSINWNIQKGSITKPTDSNNVSTYTGEEITFIPNGFKQSIMSISGNVQKDIGEYIITISLLDKINYTWSDGTTNDVHLVWYVKDIIQNYKITKLSDSKIKISHTIDQNIYQSTIEFPVGTDYNINQDTGQITFKYSDEINEELVFNFIGTYFGSMIFDVTQNNDLVIELNGFTITSEDNCPIHIISANNADISSKKSTQNYIYDNRESKIELSSAIYSNSDLKLKGTGELTVVSINNNGIYSQDDLEIQKLTLYVSSIDNALKGNDEVLITSGNITLISKKGDGIKTSNSNLSSKGNQKGSVIIEDGIINIYAACDGIDAAFDVTISGGVVNIYTDKYSEYSLDVPTTENNIYYIKATTTSYKYSIYYFNTINEGIWVNSDSNYTTQSSMGRITYYYKISKPSGYQNMAVYVYASNQTQGQSTNYYRTTGNMAVNNNYDTIEFSTSSRPESSQSPFTWTRYGSNQGPGGMQEGNTNKKSYSTKGIKANNEINIKSGTITINSYDDGLHANNDEMIESKVTPTGNINITGGLITIKTNDDGIHGDGKVLISDGNVKILSSYEGIEGYRVEISGGNVTINSTDDGINGTSTTGESIILSGGVIYVYASGDGLDSNSQSSYDGILFSGGYSVIISNGRADSSIDTERGYKYTGGYVIGIGISGGMSSESTKSSPSISSIGTTATVSLSQGGYLLVSNVACIRMPSSISAFVVAIGNPSSKISSLSTSNLTFDDNGVSWMIK